MIKEKINKILLFSLAIIFSLTITELSLRLIGYLYVKQRSTKEITRNQEIAVDKLRIVCLGDSNTYGTGAKPGYSYPEQLQRMLDKSEPGKYKVYNLTLPAANSSMLLKRFPNWIKTYKPNMAIVLIGINDNWNFAESNYHLICRGLRVYLYRFESWLGRLRVYKLIKIALARKKEDVGYSQAEIRVKPINIELKEKISLCTKYCYEEVDYNKAEKLAREILEQDPRSDIAYKFLGDLTFDFDQEKAVTFYEKAVELNPYNKEARLCLFDGYRRIGDLKKSKKELREIVKLFPEENELIKVYKVGIPQLNDEELYTKLLIFNFRKMAELSKQADMVLMLLNYPFRGDTFLLRAIEIVTTEYKLPYCDNRNLIDITEENRDYYFWSDERHFNENGYHLLARNIFNKIEELNKSAE